MLKKKIVVFDVDDILWPLNKRMAKLANIDFQKITTYSITENPNFNDEQKQRILSVYTSVGLFENIEWYDGIDRINNIDADVRINSNVYSQTVADLKIKQLQRILNLPDNKMQMNIISIPDTMTAKTINDEVYIFVDDSPVNVLASKAKCNIMLRRPWNSSNQVQEQLKKNNKCVIMCDTLNDAIDKINDLINNT